MDKNLYLIGYRGTGKTTLGKIIAEKLGKNFVDTDDLIVELAGKSIPKIFEEDGEEKFREIETEALKKASEKEDYVIACGGGIIVKERNFKFLKTGIVCLLTASEETIYKCIFEDGNRPSLTDKDPRTEIHEVLEFRKPLYEKASDFEVSTDGFLETQEEYDKYNNQKAYEVIKKYKELLEND
jgi:shikimate kinase